MQRISPFSDSSEPANRWLRFTVKLSRRVHNSLAMIWNVSASDRLEGAGKGNLRHSQAMGQLARVVTRTKMIAERY